VVDDSCGGEDLASADEVIRMEPPPAPEDDLPARVAGPRADGGDAAPAKRPVLRVEPPRALAARQAQRVDDLAASQGDLSADGIERLVADGVLLARSLVGAEGRASVGDARRWPQGAAALQAGAAADEHRLPVRDRPLAAVARRLRVLRRSREIRRRPLRRERAWTGRSHRRSEPRSSTVSLTARRISA
jgi:hypothetical protein